MIWRHRRSISLALLLFGLFLMGSHASAAGTKWAVLVSIDHYRNRHVSSLKYAVADVKAVSKDLVHYDGFPANQVFTMTSDVQDEDDPNYPSNNNIFDRLATLSRHINPEDTFRFYFSGHGFQKGAGSEFLGSINADPTTLQSLELTTIPLQTLREQMKSIQARKVIFIIDACRNDPEGGRGDSPNTQTAAFTRDLQTVVNATAGGAAGTAVLFACSEGQRSWEWPEMGHGAFTYYLMQGLEGKAALDNGDLTMTGLGKYVQQQVAAWAHAHNAQQTPDLEQQGSAEIVLGHVIPGGGGGGNVQPVDTLARISITTEPAGAEVYVDGIDQRMITPCDLDIDLDIARIRQVEIGVKLDGYQLRKQKVTLRRAQSVIVNWPLQRGPQPRPVTPLPVLESPPTAGLVAYYPFSGSANDAGRRSNDGTVHGATLTADRFGKPDAAYSFNGTGDYIEADATGLPEADRTISLWFNAKSVPNAPESVILGYGGGTCGTSFFLSLADAQTPFRIASHCGVNAYTANYGRVTLSRWHHWVVATGPGGTTMYVDGQKVFSSEASITGTNSGGTKLEFGVDVDGGGSGHYTDGNGGWFNGALDDVRIYDRALSAAEVQRLYHEGGWDWRGAVGPQPVTPPSPQANQKVNPKDGAEMVYVPAGPFIMGSDDGQDNERPQHQVTLDGYWIYKNLVTVAQYQKFCDATGHPMPAELTFTIDGQNSVWRWADHQDHPIANVTYEDAEAYCAWAGARLPTEAQWEKAARGTDGRTFPWGNVWDASKLRCSVGETRTGTMAVASFPLGASPYGCMDMLGNLWEICADFYDDNYYQNAPASNPTGPATGTVHVMRGGAWSDPSPVVFRCSFRRGYHPGRGDIGDGFRCVMRAGP